MTIDEFLEGFENPPREYGLQPFWFWNGDLEPEELLRQIQLMHEAGVTGFVIHARFGLTVEYLSETWFERVGLVLSKARELGMVVWIYDEENWASGYAGGRVLQRDPSLTPQCLSFERVWLDEGEDMIEAPRPRLDDPRGRGEIIAVNAVPILSATHHPKSPFEWHGPNKRLEPKWHDRGYHELTMGQPIELVLPREVRRQQLIRPATDVGTREKAEREILGLSLLGDRPMQDRLRFIQESHFHDPRHRAIFNVLKKQCLDSREFCLETVLANLESTDLATLSKQLADEAQAVRDELRIYFKNPGGRWLITIHRRETTEWYPAYTPEYYTDVLRQETAPIFLEETHEKYWARFQEFFGNTIQGFFVDEPGLYNNFWDRNVGSLPWTEDFAEAFKAAKGYDVRSKLMTLYERLPGSDQVRFDYYDFVGELMQKRFMEPLTRWCELKGVQHTGHLMLEEFMVTMARYAGNPFRQLRSLHTPGVDRIDEVYEKLAERIASSVAHLTGRQRVISETYALIGWKLAPPYMKEIFDYQAARGVNLLSPHAFYYSIAEHRKDECPPSEFFQNPWWGDFKPFSDYVRRLSFALSQGKPKKDFLLYYPIETIYTLISPEYPRSAAAGPTEHWQLQDGWHPAVGVDQEYVKLVVRLEESGFDFDLIDHTFLSEAEVRDGRLKIGDVDVDTLVLALAQKLSPSAAAKIREFQATGGTVIRFACDGETIGQPGEKVDSPALPIAPLNLIAMLQDRCGSSLTLEAESLNQIRTPSVADPRREVRWVDSPGWSRCTRTLGDGTVIHFVAANPNHPVKAKLSGFASLDARTGKVVEDSLNLAKLAVDRPLPCAHVFQPDQWIELEQGRLVLGDEAIEITGLRSWAALGHPFFSGAGTYTFSFELQEGTDPSRCLVEAELFETARLTVNGRDLGSRAFPPYTWEADRLLRPGRNEIALVVSNTMQGRFENKERIAGLLRLRVGTSRIRG